MSDAISVRHARDLAILSAAPMTQPVPEYLGNYSLTPSLRQVCAFTKQSPYKSILNMLLKW